MSRPPLDPLARELAVIRMAAGISQGEVARRIGSCTGWRVHEMEAGTRHLTVGTLHRWAAALGCEVVLVRKTVTPEPDDGGLS